MLNDFDPSPTPLDARRRAAILHRGHQLARRRRLLQSGTAVVTGVAIAVASSLVLVGHGSPTTVRTVGQGLPSCPGPVPTAAVEQGEDVHPTYLPAGMVLTSGSETHPEIPFPPSYTAPGDPGRSVEVFVDPGTSVAAAVPSGAPRHPVTVRGRPGILLTPQPAGPPGVGSRINVAWQEDASTVINISATGLTQAQLLAVANGIVYRPPALVILPDRPGDVVSRATAIDAARGAVPGQASLAVAALTSWSEADALAPPPTGSPGPGGVTEPAGLHPWDPVWVVTLTGHFRPTAAAPGQGQVASWAAVTVDATTGQTVGSNEGQDFPPAFLTQLTDRAASCPGVPLGVLTRPEVLALAGDRWSGDTVKAKLVSIQALARSTQGELTQCLAHGCYPHELVWLVLLRGQDAGFAGLPPGVVPSSRPAGPPWMLVPLDATTGQPRGDTAGGQGPDPSDFTMPPDLDVVSPAAPPGTVKAWTHEKP